MSQALGKGSKWLGAGSRGMSNLTAAVLVFLAGALIYHFVVNMRRGK
mgnify:CR=1 FL=1